jgi:hypothetical protein
MTMRLLFIIAGGVLQYIIGFFPLVAVFTGHVVQKQKHPV